MTYLRFWLKKTWKTGSSFYLYTLRTTFCRQVQVAAFGQVMHEALGANCAISWGGTASRGGRRRDSHLLGLLLWEAFDRTTNRKFSPSHRKWTPKNKSFLTHVTLQGVEFTSDFFKESRYKTGTFSPFVPWKDTSFVFYGAQHGQRDTSNYKIWERLFKQR